MIITKKDIATNPHWFREAVDDFDHKSRVNDVLTIKEYLLRKHKILMRPNGTWKDEIFETAKIVLNSMKSIVTFHAGYILGNQVSLSGNSDIVLKLSQSYKRGGYAKTDYELTLDLYKYGNAFEYVYLDGNTVRSRIIANEDAFPIYDEMYNYIAFVEYWQDTDNMEHYIVYYHDRVETWLNGILTDTKMNLSGLPIHYASLDKAADRIFGDSMLLDLIPIMDNIEYLLSKLDDAITTLSLNPIGVVSGKRIEGTVDKDLVGNVLQLDSGDVFDFKTVQMDYSNVKFEFDQLLQQFYATAMVPATVIGQSNIANVSEVSLKMLFNMSDNRARETMHVLRDGFYKRFEYFRKLLAYQDTTFADDDFDSLDVLFNVSRPVDTSSQMQDLERQYGMGAISRQTIIDTSPYTNNTAVEIERIAAEQNQNKKENA